MLVHTKAVVPAEINNQLDGAAESCKVESRPVKCSSAGKARQVADKLAKLGIRCKVRDSKLMIWYVPADSNIGGRAGAFNLAKMLASY